MACGYAAGFFLFIFGYDDALDATKADLEVFLCIYKGFGDAKS